MSMSGEAKYQRMIDIAENLSSQGLPIPKEKAIEMAEKERDNEEEDLGYIDHQSVGDAEEIFLNYESIKKVVFGKESSITIDNDNH